MEKDIRKPDFFIVGAPKCGTTAMYEYLKQHPEIFMPDVKEIHFFGKDLDFKLSNNAKDEYQYLSLFSKTKNEKRLGEASVWYLYSKMAALEIKEFCPSARIIIMLRNPVDMLYSLHSQFLYEGNEDLIDFKEALDAEEDRKRGLRVPRFSYCAKTLFYREVASYTEQVRRYLNVFGRENVQIIIFDDFKKNTSKIYKETLHFLDVYENIQPNFKVINPNKQVRSIIVQKFLLKPPQFILHYGQYLRVPIPLQKVIIEIINRLNTSSKPRKSLDPELRQHLLWEFKVEVEHLSDLIGRDLSFWIDNRMSH